MSIEAMKQALEALEMMARYENPETRIQVRKPKEGGAIVTMYPHKVASDAAAAIRAAIRAAIEEHQTSLELCDECGWRAMIPGDGCLICARQKAKPVAWMYDFLNSDNRDEVIRDWMTQDYADIARENGFNVRPLYTVPPAAPKPYRRGTYVRCMESDELCRVWTTSIDGGAWVKWPDGSITTYTAEQMGQAFSLEQAAPGKPVAYVDERIHGWPDCFVMEPDPPHTMPLYTEPREWVGLTDEEIEDEWEKVTGHSIFGGDRSAGRSMFLSPDEVIHYTQAIETKLKEKNT